MAKLKTRGQLVSDPKSQLTLWSGPATVREMVRLDVASRAGQPTQEIEAKDDDLVEVELDNDVVFWTSFWQLKKDTEDLDSRDVSDGLPTRYRLAGTKDRGVTGVLIKSLKFLGYDVAKESVTLVAKKIEAKLAGPAGFYRIDKEGKLAPDSIPRGSDPVLVFIHGTASSTDGGFSGLTRTKEMSQQWMKLHKEYSGRIFGFEHRSLTESPIQNAAQFLEDLPSDRVPPLHLVSHSRGGLVGDVVAHGGLGVEAFSRGLLEAAGVSNDEELAAYDRVNGLLAGRAPSVERFVRVACPAGGTTLASDRLDIYLSLLFRLLSKTPLIGPVLEGVGELLAAVAKQRSNPEVLPGLEAQRPSSSFIRVLNGSGHALASDLTVISGDSDGLLKNLANLYYWRANDLVVDTRSMYLGATRKNRIWFRAEGRDVHHCNYFRRGETVSKLVAGLTRSDQDDSEFSSQRPRSVARGYVAPAKPEEGKALPAVVLVPGIMGSHLSVVRNGERDRIWIDVADLMRGRFLELGINAPDVEPAGVVERAYADLVAFLRGKGHQVIPFPYDWRKSVADAADGLAALLRARLEASKQPIRIVAHSMGGLVARYLMAEHADVWRDVETGGGRLLQLGTPNAGSYLIPRLLQGKGNLLRKLALLDFPNGVDRWVKLISRFSGLLDLAPQGAVPDFSDPQTWQNLQALTVPRRADLQRARRVSHVLQGVDLSRHPVVYVAGRAPSTPTISRELDRIEFTPRGDGRVTWDSGIPGGVPCWYVDVKHGSLLDHPPAFDGLLELIEDGTTKRLTDKEPSTRRSVGASSASTASIDGEEHSADIFPNQASLEVVALGMEEDEPWIGPARADSAVDVRVVHGDLTYAGFPVMVGHYAGDPILHAEGTLDNLLDGALSARHQLDLYPRDVGSHEVFLQVEASEEGPILNGAVVIGLGQTGSLSPGGLARSVEKAVVRYVQTVEESLGRESLPVEGLGLTSLLVGSGDSGVSLVQALDAILGGVRQANRRLQTQSDGDALRGVRRLDLIEFYEDLALETLRELRDCALDGFAIHPDLVRREGGCRRASRRESPGWWRPLTIKQKEKRAGQLEFSTADGRARVTDVPLEIQPGLVHRLLEQPLGTVVAVDRQLSETLFELLVPRCLKDSAGDSINLLLGLDDETARYPWELLLDRYSPSEVPLSVQAGLVRQLHVKDRPVVPGVEENRVLVVGNPPTGLPDLRGAEREALAVAALFRKPWKVVRQIKNDPDSEKCPGNAEIDPKSIVGAAMTSDFRVVHLAGHGIYDRDNPMRSGMVLSGSPPTDPDAVLFSPAEVAQMRRAPDLVFINCCHLGRIESTPPHLLAANLATQFIHNGVRAVVAAGWAVDDEAALTFATAFYERLFAGKNFGDAVLEARRETYKRHPDSNTWGAFQCYGDPGFRLMLDLDSRGGGSGRRDYVDPRELVVDLENLVGRARGKSPKDDRGEQRKQIVSELAELTRIAENREWLSQADVAAGIARVYGELGDFDDAIVYYGRARESEAGTLDVEDLRQLANLRARRADTLPKTSAIATIRQSVRELELLTELSPSSETWSNLGSAHKRLVQMVPSRRAAMKSLHAMAAAYAQAAVRTPEKLYPVLNALSGVLVLGGPWAKVPGRMPTEIRENPLALKDTFDCVLERARMLARRKAREPGNFWDRSFYPDVELVAALASGRLARSREMRDRLLDRYLDLFAGSGSPREHASVVDQIRFLAGRYRCLAASRKNVREESGFLGTAKCLESIVKRLSSDVR